MFYTFMFECDDYGFNGWRKPRELEPNELLEWITIHVKSLQARFPMLGHAVIKRSGQGFHVVFPESRVTMQQFNMLLTEVPHDVGWCYWTNVHGRATLRISAKPIVQTVNGENSKHLGTKTTLDKPQTIRLIHPNGLTLCRKEIVQRYGEHV